jgi:plasmid maintenance system antidote protein VapI
MMTIEKVTSPSLADLANALVQVEAQIRDIRNGLLAYESSQKSQSQKKSGALLLDKVMTILELRNDAALSRVLGVAAPVISKIRNDLAPVGPALLVRIHEETGLSVRELKSYLEPAQLID